MYQKLNIPTIGIVENMSYYACPNCHHEADIFGHGGGERLAEQLDVPFLGRLPIYQPIREGSDSGVPLVVSEPGSSAGRAFMTVAERTAAQVSIARAQGGRSQQRQDSADSGSLRARDRSQSTCRTPNARSPTASTSSSTRITTCRSWP